MPSTTTVPGTDVVSYAQTLLGRPYRWGATGPNAFDCSGFVDYVYKHFGVTVPRTTAEMQAGKGGLKPVDVNHLQAGDLVLSRGWVAGNPGQGHVGIYMGQGRIIEAGDPVQITTLGPTYKAHVTGYRRVPGVTGYGDVSSAVAGSLGDLSIGGGGIVGPGLSPGDMAWLNTVRSWIPHPTSVTEGLTNIGEGILGVARSASEVGQLAGTFSRLLLPTNLVRAFLMFMGVVFVLIGIWFIAMEAKDS